MKLQKALVAGVACRTAVFLVLVTPALAKYYGGTPPPAAEANPFQSDTASLFWGRLLPILASALSGFLVGAFFSPALRTFRRYLLLGLLVASVAFALFGSAPAADALSYLVAFFVGMVAFWFGLRLGTKAVRSLMAAAAKRRRPTATARRSGRTGLTSMSIG